MTHKEMWIAKHDELIENWLEENPDGTEEDAQDATAHLVDDMVQDYYCGLGDYRHDQAKDRKLEERKD
jgi:hypothetical protein|tara:strand:- start:3144 stop:3347 length:204 start_codon:yes stop_codon:yes gene_type:complete